MIIEFDSSECKRCKSCNTSIQILVPDKEIKRGNDGKYSTEVVCNDCGKISRINLKVKFS